MEKVKIVRMFGNNIETAEDALTKDDTKVRDNAFKNHISLKEVIIPEGVKKIGKSAFSECINLQKITLPSTLQKIDDYAFEGCEMLTEIKIPASVTEIGDCVFDYCDNLEKIIFESLDTLEYFGEHAAFKPQLFDMNGNELEFKADYTLVPKQTRDMDR